MKNNTFDIIQISQLKSLAYYDEAEVTALVSSIKYANGLRPISVTNDGIILNGHSRVEALKRLGITKVPVVYLDLDKIDFETNDCQINKLYKWLNDHGMPLMNLFTGFKCFINGTPLSILEPYVIVPLNSLMIKTLCVGVFDLFHIGHFNMLRNASMLGNKLIVGVQYNVEKYKDSKIYYDFDSRFFMVQSLRFVDVAVPYDNVYDLIEAIDFDIFAFGPDQNHCWFEKSKDYCLKNEKKCVLINRTQGISSSQIRNMLSL